MSIVLDGTTGLAGAATGALNGALGATTPSTVVATTISGTDLTTTGNTILGNASTDTLNVGNGGLVKDASGNVGIGTASPTRLLDVSNTAGDATVAITSSTTGQSSVWFADTDTNIGGLYYEHTNNAMGFRTNDVERMRIDSSGNLLVSGLTSQIYSGRICIADNMTNFNPIVIKDTQNSSFSNICYEVFLNSGDVIAGKITHTASTTVAYVTTSDYRLKENIAPMTGALEKVALLKPVTYTWKADGSNGQGFIAHELQEVVPDCVDGEKDAVNEDGSINPQGIDTSFLVATLTAAIQELNAKFEAYKASHP